MPKYPTVDHVLVKDLAEGDNVIALQVGNPPTYVSLISVFSLVDSPEDAVTTARVVSVSTADTVDGWRTTLELQGRDSLGGGGESTIQTLSVNPLSVATIAVGDLTRLVP